MIRVLSCLAFLLVALPVEADVVIHTRDGKVHRIPVEPSEITSIEFLQSSGTATAPSPVPVNERAGTPWVVNSSGHIYRWGGHGWQQMPGLAHNISAGANGDVWVIGTDSVAGGYGIYRWSGSDWSKVDGGAVSIAVGPDGDPWVVNSEGRIFRRKRNNWQELPGRAKDLGIGANGNVWAIGTDSAPGGYGIYQWSGSDWTKVEGGAVRIAVGSDGDPWVVTSESRIYRRKRNDWQELPGRAKDIGIGANGAVWVIGTDSVPGGGGIYNWDGWNWVQVEGGAVGITVR